MGHVEFMMEKFSFKNLLHWPFLVTSGNLGVVCFFVLSGFLITFLLLKEQQEYQKIHIAKFYWRRIVRIWPIYYLLIILNYLVLPHFPLFQFPNRVWPIYSIPQILMYLFFLPNLVTVLYSPFSYIGHLWSIGVEEQFYLFWPWILNKKGNLLKRFLLFLIIFWFIKFILIILASQSSSSIINYLLTFVHITNYDSLVIGALGVLVIKLQPLKKIKEIIFSRIFQLFFYPVLFILVITGFYFPYINTQVYSFLFIILILNLAANPRCIITIENNWLNYLGKISYGLYIYHIIAITAVLKIARSLNLDNYPLLLSSSLLFTILISIFSYHFIEKPFLRLKQKFTLVPSNREM